MHVWTKRRARGFGVVYWVGLLLLLGYLSGCGTSPKHVLRQGSGPTVLQIMKGDVHQAGVDGTATNKVLGRGDAVKRLPGRTSTMHGAYTRNALNEHRQLFPNLPNPTIALYVYAHPVVDPNTHETLPVPGYTTAFPLYSRVQFALPGELPASRHPLTPVFPAARATDMDVPFVDTELPQ